MAAFDLEQYLAQGVRHILTGLTAAAGKNIKTAAFLARFAMAAQSAKHRRVQLAAAGEHIPPFLIASITEQCNLHCRGCYARAGGVCCDGGADDVLTAAQWADLFTQAAELGVSFVLLAGGEPLLRPDVLAAAAREKRIIFPVFTNGTLFSPDACALFLQNRNLMPVLSLEGDAAATDARRGSGVYRRLQRGRPSGQRPGADLAALPLDERHFRRHHDRADFHGEHPCNFGCVFVHPLYAACQD